MAQPSARLTAYRPALPRADEGLLGIVCSTPFLTAVLLILTWPFTPLAPSVGLDPSWQAGLYMGFENGLQFGREIVFTYGPLGFLHAPVLFGEATWLAAIAYLALARVALVVSLLWVARRALPLPLAAAACFVILVVAPVGAAIVLVAFIWCFVAVRADPPPFATPLLVYGGAALAAFELLGKINYGISVLALCAVALAAIPGRRANLTRFAAVFAASLLALWLLSGQAIANLPDYGSHAFQILSGYSQTMGADIGRLPGEIPLALFAIVILAAGVGLATAGAGRRVRIASLLLFAVFAYLSFKQDFVRRGPDHRTEFALLMSAAALTVAARLPRRGGATLPPLPFSAALVAPLLALVVWALPTASFWTSLEPGPHITSLREDAEAALSPSTRRDIRTEARAAMRAEYDLPASISERVGGRPVAIEPWEIGVAWAYGLNWQPLPVFQDYSAYTAQLDQLNADALSAHRPATVLRQNTGDKLAPTDVSYARYPSWDSPAAKLALLCNYRAALTTPRWQLLEAAPARCGPARSLGEVTAETGAAIPVPASTGRDENVFARIHGLGVTESESVRSLAYRAPGRSVSFDRGRAWNLAYTTAADGLILRAPASVDFPRPFQLAPDPHVFSVGISGGASRSISVEFFAQHVSR